MRARTSGGTVALLLIALGASAWSNPGTASAQDLRSDYFVHEFWTELEPMAYHPGGPLTQEQAVKQILTEAQFVFSGEVYGFTFTYTPADPERNVAESFDLEPVATITWGDPHLKVLDTRVDDRRLIARVMYSLMPFQESWEQSWNSNVYPTSSGRGEGNYALGFDEKIASYKDAVKEAIRDYLRPRVLNEPKEITGRLVLRGEPNTVIESGKYVTTLSIRLQVDRIQPYTVF